MIIILITTIINRPLSPRFPINANSELLIDCLPASSNVGGRVKLWNNLAFVDISNQYIFEDHHKSLYCHEHLDFLYLPALLALEHTQPALSPDIDLKSRAGNDT